MVVLTDTRRGGTPKRIATIVRGLRDRGWETAVVSLLPAGPVLQELREQGCETADLSLTSLRLAPSAALELRGIVKAWNPSLVQSALWHANILATCAASGMKIPIVWSHEGMEDGKPWNRILLDRALSRFAAAHVCVSKAVARRAEERDRISAAKAVVIPIGKDPNRFGAQGRRDDVRRRLGIPVDAIVVGWVGRLHPVKNLPMLFQAVGLLPNAWLLVVGYGEQEHDLKTWARHAGLEGRWVLTGEVDAVAPYLEAMDVFCLASLHEGSSGALVEAMAAGLPVVATNIAGMSEIVEHGKSGLLVEPDPAGIRAGVLEALGRPDLGEKARAVVEKRFSEEAMIEAYDALWKRLAHL